MRRYSLWVCLCLILATVLAHAEEFVLKDGTKIVGRMIAIKGDTIQVETLYGKIKLSRADIVTISFVENQPKPPSPPDPQPSFPVVDHSLEGTSYINKTGNFKLTLPLGWKIDDQVRTQDSIGGLSHAGGNFLVVVQEAHPGSLKAYKEVLEAIWKNSVPGYEKFSETSVTIDGREGLFVILRGNPPEVPITVKFLVGIVAENGRVTRIVVWCAEPLFEEAQKTFEKIILSYETIR